MNRIITTACLGLVLTIPASANAAFFDFQQWIVVNGEQGFINSSPFLLSDAGLTLTVKAFENQGSTESHVYMDNEFNGINGGMGVCTELTAGNHCTPSSDDNVSIDESNAEILSWSFSQNVTKLKMELGNSEYYDFGNSDFMCRFGDSGWLTVTTDSGAMVTLLFTQSTGQIEFKAAGEDPSYYF